jgi:hypothetical protein
MAGSSCRSGITARPTVQAKAGTRAALEGVKVAEGPKDVRRLARLAEAKGGKTRAILKLAGRGALALTAALLDLVWWICMAVGSAFGFAATVKRITERATVRYLRWSKARRTRPQPNPAGASPASQCRASARNDSESRHS